MKQMTLATVKGFEKHGRTTRKAEFLARMDGLMPWAEFCALIEPHYPKAGNGRPPCYAPLKLSLSDPSYSGATNGACPSVMWAGHAPGKERDRNAIYLTAAKSRGGRGRR